MDPDKTTQGADDTMTRRQMLTNAAVGGVAFVAGGLGGSMVGSTSTRAEAEIELLKLRALITLYEQLEKVGIDAIVSVGMGIVRGALDGLKNGVRLAREGVVAAENALKNAQAMLDGLRAPANAVVQAVTDLSQKFKIAEGIVIGVLGVALPLAESIAGFFNSLIQKIPLGVGDNIRQAVSALVDLVRAIPATVDVVTNQLLKSLRDLLLSTSGDPSIKINLFDPLVNNLLTPLKKFLTDVENLFDRWEKDFATPVQDALDQRAKIRKQIAALRKDIGLA